MCISHDQESLVWEIHFLFWKVTGKNEFQLSKFSREELENKENQKSSDGSDFLSSKEEREKYKAGKKRKEKVIVSTISKT